ncbi:hypothetical protein Brsp05_03435 [Brucella sp. NBRC 12953]
MAIVWEQRDREAGFVRQMLMSILVSGIVSVACNVFVPRPHIVAQRPANPRELGVPKGVLDSLEVRLRKTTLATAALHRDFAVLTAENGILNRVIAHMQAIREENALLSQSLLALQATPRAFAPGAGATSAPEHQAAQTRTRPRHGSAAELTIVTAAKPSEPDQSESQNIRSSADGGAKAAIKPAVQGG